MLQSRIMTVLPQFSVIEWSHCVNLFLRPIHFQIFLLIAKRFSMQDCNVIKNKSGDILASFLTSFLASLLGNSYKRKLNRNWLVYKEKIFKFGVCCTLANLHRSVTLCTLHICSHTPEIFFEFPIQTLSLGPNIKKLMVLFARLWSNSPYVTFD